MKYRRLLLLLALAFVAPLSATAELRCAETYASLVKAPVALKGADLKEAVYRRLEELAKAPPPGVSVETIGYSDGLPLYLVRVKSIDSGAPRVFLSSGVHGNEPGGVLTGMGLLEDIIKARDYNLTFAPVMNPGGLTAETRRNSMRLDINRSFADSAGSEASRALKNAIGAEKFDVAVDLHGANYKTQFFLIAAKEEGARAAEILAHVPNDLLLPSTSGTYPGYAPAFNDPERYRMLFPGSAVSSNEGTLKDYLAQRAPRSYTLEYPGAVDFTLQQKWNSSILKSILESARGKN